MFVRKGIAEPLRSFFSCRSKLRLVQSVGGKLELKQSRCLRTTPSFFVKGTAVNMPSLSPTMTEGTIIKWHKKEGDKIEPGDAICDIQTDKAVMSFEMDDEAILAKILVKEDSKDIKIGSLIALLVEEGEDWKDVEMPVGEPAVAAKSPAASAHPDKPTATLAEPPSPASNVGGKQSNLLGPSVRNLLQQYDLKQNQISASGPHDTLLKGDVLNYIKTNNISAKTADEIAARKAKSVSSNRQQTSKSNAPKYVDIELSNMRKIIAKRLTQSKTTIPHAYMAADCEVSRVIKLRKELKQSGVNVSVNDFIIKAAGVSLRKTPEVNVRWNEDSGTVEAVDLVDISIAVATPNGLITPIIKNANTLSVEEVSSTVKELAEKAKVGKLQPHEFQGGSFSISNLGMFGITEFSAVINPPQAAILAVGTSRVVVNDQGGVDQLMTVTLSYDARAIEEEAAARFLEEFGRLMGNPVLMDREGDGSSSRRLNALLN